MKCGTTVSKTATLLGINQFVHRGHSVDYLRRFLLGHHDLAIKGEKEKGYRRKEALIPLDRKPP
ncbi:hypothetical protein EWB00_004020 [Schistosoma japonicum]|uniref:Uncharacterized protein n=1 Tax=Schistosoma japonicum TaxID=6182 RepID=A0A4Z2DVB7_SCHJA|nr:hypothetical protein EWB00_004020 [Schistosoma japonicum]